MTIGLKNEPQNDRIKRNQEKFTGEILQEFWRGNSSGSANPENEGRMRTWLSGKGISVPIAVFLLDERFADARGQMVLDLLSSPAGEPAKRVSPQLPPDKAQIANLIAARFAEAGFGRVQQIAAIANAIGESNLDPNMQLQQGEDSVGLFLLNRKGGLGTGFSVEQLKDPEINIAIIVKAAEQSVVS